MTERNIVETTREILDAANERAVIERNSRALVVMKPPGYTLETVDIEQWSEHPVRSRGFEEFRELDSFLEYVGEHSRLETLVVMTDNHVKATFNHHGDSPGWCDRGAKFRFTRTSVYETWAAKHGMIATPRSMIEFFEDNRDELITPALGDLITTLRGLKVKTAASKSVRTESFADSNAAESSVEVAAENGDLPERFTAAIRIFQGGKTFEIDGRLRIHTANGLGVSFNLINLERAAERQLDLWRGEIQDATGLKVHR